METMEKLVLDCPYMTSDAKEALMGGICKFDANGIQSALYSANKVLLKNGIHDCEIRLDYDGGYFIVQRMENGDEASSEDETSWNVASRIAEFLGEILIGNEEN